MPVTLNGKIPGRSFWMIPVVLVILLLLAAGLWPFNFYPENGVAWSKEGDGLLFHRPGIVFEDGEPGNTVPGPVLRGQGPWTLEIALVPGALPDPSVGVILCVDDGGRPEGFTLAQWRSALVLRARRDRMTGGKAFEEVGKDDLLIPGNPCFLTLTFGPSGTILHVDGEPAGCYPALAWPGPRRGEDPCRLVLGNGITGCNPWLGKIRGLALRNGEASPGEAEQGFRLFEQDGFAAVGEPGQGACFPMREGRGAWIREAGSRCRSLHMPERFRILSKQVLRSPLEDWRLGNLRPGDMALNLTGFLVFGFIVAAGCATIPACRGPRLMVLVTLAACGLSLFIELWQADLPGRHSSLADWSLNTLGGALGAFLLDPVRAAVRSLRRKIDGGREAPGSDP